ncbi:pyridoxal phosphate-dependent transferase [Pelagophyceae sp. CCMP2097]|nr:pyridoxal phosphate-dependent transferase [Pelagophyceae sp. CCMP2097]
MLQCFVRGGPRPALRRSVRGAATFVRGAAKPFADDFAHHAPGVARWNNGSFGAVPRPVLEAQQSSRMDWLSQPDALYFSGLLDAELEIAADAAALAMGAPTKCVALVENSGLASSIILQRWRNKLDASKNKVLALSSTYGGVRNAMVGVLGEERCCFSNVEFPRTTHFKVLESLETALRLHWPRFALLDHISSQPAIVLPVREMVALCRQYGVEEVAVDGAHVLGQLPLDVLDVGADWFFTNVHKWAFGPAACAAVYAPEDVLQETRHVVSSWHTDKGLAKESRWPGTRDFSAALVVPGALEYHGKWRSVQNLSVTDYNVQGCRDAEYQLRDAWGVEEAYSEECIGAMAMVRLPLTIDASLDAPGRPAAQDSLRSILRQRYGVEAAVGEFQGRGFIRLSHAVYNTDLDLVRLRDAILDIAERR